MATKLFRSTLWCVALPFCLALASAPGFAKDSVRASQGELTLPTYPWAAVKHPYFRGTDKVNIYPYPMLDFLSRERTNRTYRTVMLENEYLRITFLPELGGKVHEVIDKTTGQPMFYVNHVIKPGLIGQCGAWTSGGIEWNTGPQGHTVSAMQPVPVEILPPEKDGSRSVAIGETERIYGTRWTVVLTLRPGRSFIEERIRIYNPTETVRPYYFWNCTAVPNTPGFRFIYSMTLGCDHGGEKFFDWPIDHGKDLTRGTNYQDCASIFAWHCDQDFFGSYDDGADHGVVAFANHHQVPGKKAWTWGQGGFGKMHQADLTDNDGPYNEVQTGPLLTQGEVGRLDPCEAVSWQEWWYPVHAIGGFTFANREVAVNAEQAGETLRLRLLGTGNWSPVRARVFRGTNELAHESLKLSPGKPAEWRVALREPTLPAEVQLSFGKQVLARFTFPLDLPVRTRPEKPKKPDTAAELAQAGWQHYLFARYPEAQAEFKKALAKDRKQVQAHTGLAFLNLEREPAAAASAARKAVAVQPDHGLAHFALAVAERELGHDAVALDEAWEAALDPATAVPARALVGKLLIQRGDWDAAIEALAHPGLWGEDPVCRDRLAFALLKRHDYTLGPVRPNKPTDDDLRLCSELVADSLRLDPLDPVAGHLSYYLRNPPDRVFSFYAVDSPGPSPGENAFPYRAEWVPILRQTLEKHPGHGQLTLALGHLLFHLGREAEGREMWQRAAKLGTEPVIAYRALGMASLTLDNDPDVAAKYLTLAHELDPADAIVARDLARVILAQADKAELAERKKELWARARDVLQPAFASGRGRSDFVALLARAQNKLGDFEDAGFMLDRVRVTVWEGSHEIHDLFEEAHLALGKAHLEAGRAAAALTDFNRALEYPANLATGKLENAREAHINYLRGNALAALGRQQDAIIAWKLAADEPKCSDPQKEAARKKAKEALAGAAR